jgi:DNA modification methylase
MRGQVQQEAAHETGTATAGRVVIEPHYADDSVTLHHGDCLDVLRELPDASVDAVVTDPPYGLEFMGREWDSFRPKEKSWNTDTTTRVASAPIPTATGAPDATPAPDTTASSASSADASGAPTDPARAASATIVQADAIGGFQDGNGGNAYSRSRVRSDTRRHGGDMLTANHGFQSWCEQWATECLRVLKPGGHLLAFGGTRTWHRLACAIEDAGFEVRDSIAWLYGSGFPKSLDVSKAIDKRREDRADILNVTTTIRILRDAAGLTNRDLDDLFGFAGMAGHWTSTASQPAVPTVEQWARLREVLNPSPALDAEVWRLNGRKGTPGEAWQNADVLRTEDRMNEASGVVNVGQGERTPVTRQIKAANTDDARTWQGWGTALKPAHEPIVHGVKPRDNREDANVSQEEASSRDHLPARDVCAGDLPDTDGAPDAELRRVRVQGEGESPALDGPAHEPIVVARKPLGGAVSVRGIVENGLRQRGVTGDIEWTSGLVSGAASPDQPQSSSSTPAPPMAGTSADPADASATLSVEKNTASDSELNTSPGEPLTASTSGPTPDSEQRNFGASSSTPTVPTAPVVESPSPTSSSSTTSTAAGAPTVRPRTARSTSSSDARDSRPVTESFAGIATGLIGSLAVVRIDRLTDGTFVWPDGLPESVAGGSTVAANVLAHGTGALNIDGCRVGDNPGYSYPNGAGGNTFTVGGEVDGTRTEPVASTQGRWPANVVLDPDAAAELDRQSGTSKSPSGPVRGPRTHGGVMGQRLDGGLRESNSGHGDTGGASRFFFVTSEDHPCSVESSATVTPPGTHPSSDAPPRNATASDVASGSPRFIYVAKAPTTERPRVAKEGAGNGRVTGLAGKVRQCNVCETRAIESGAKEPSCGHGDYRWAEPTTNTEHVAHPTVKPLDLMRWLVRLVTPPGGTVLDPFAGSGTTAEACVLEHMRCITIEREADYLPLIVARLSKPLQVGFDFADTTPAPRPPDNGRSGEASAERRYTARGGTNFAMKPGPRYDRRPATPDDPQVGFDFDGGDAA